MLENRENMLVGLNSIQELSEGIQNKEIDYLIDLCGNAKVLEYRCSRQKDLNDIFYEAQNIQMKIKNEINKRLKN